jgi:hypothetical protein
MLSHRPNDAFDIHQIGGAALGTRFDQPRALIDVKILTGFMTHFFTGFQAG